MIVVTSYGECPLYETGNERFLFCFQACPTADCNKKLIEEGDGNYRCEKCNRSFPNFQYRLILSVRDGHSFINFATF